MHLDNVRQDPSGRPGAHAWWGRGRRALSCAAGVLGVNLSRAQQQHSIARSARDLELAARGHAGGDGDREDLASVRRGHRGHLPLLWAHAIQDWLRRVLQCVLWDCGSGGSEATGRDSRKWR